MRIATLFSGIGAPEQAAERVYDAFDTIFACEFDKFARQSYSAIYNVPGNHKDFHRDVHDLDATKYRGSVDCLIGGSPCQSFSIAGLRGGTTDQRGQLIYQYVRVVEECRPNTIVYENVKGILSIDGGNTVSDFVQALRDVGYHCHYGVVNTRDYGVPQNRERFFLMGFLDSDIYHRFEFATKQQLHKTLRDVLEDSVDEKYYLSDRIIDGFKKKEQRYKEQNKDIGFCFKPLSESDVCYTITQRYHKCGPSDPYIKIAGMGGDREPKIIASRGRSKENSSDKTPGKKVEQRLEVNSSGTSNAITSVYRDNYVLEQDYKIRKLTPLECWRLQDFPDSAFQKAKDDGVSNTQLYRQAGNSMSVNVLEMIFRQIEEATNGGSRESLFSISA